MKAEPLKNDDGEIVAYLVDCPGCKSWHQLYVKGPVKWSFNGDTEKPTFSPSLLVNKDLSNPDCPRCHSFIRNGQWQFLGDCTHELAGKTVDMPDME